MISFAEPIGSRWRWLALRRTTWRGAIYVLPLAVLFAAATARVAAPDLLDRMSLICFDLYQRAAPRKPEGDTPIRIVDIDDDSLKKIGQWPWPRTLVAQLVDKLREAGASVIAFDIDFAEPDRTSPKLLLPLMAQSGVGTEEVKRLLAALPDPDQRLAASMGTLPTVTGFILTNHGDARPPGAKAGFAFAGDDPLGHVDSFPAAVDNLPALEVAAAGNGFLNQWTDWDHVVRRVPLILKFGDTPYPSLAAETLRLAFGAHGYVGRAAGANGERNFGEKTGLTAIRIGRLTVPTDASGRVWLYYAPPRFDRLVSATDVLAGHFDPALFADHIVLIGTSAAGVINDRQATPIARDIPGVEIHAQLIEQILQGAFLVRPDWALGAEVVFTLLCGMGLILGVARIGALPSAILGAANVVVVVGVSWLSFRQARLLIDPVYPGAVITLVYLVASLLGYAASNRARRLLRRSFEHYLPPTVIEQMLAAETLPKLGGERREFSVLFTDVAGFTTTCETMEPEILATICNDYFEGVCAAVFDHGGMVNEFIGDAVLAFFGAPHPQCDHADRAVAAALAIDEFAQRFSAEQKARGVNFGHTRIGVHTGTAIVGNIGIRARLKYGAQGDMLNTGARLDGLNKTIGTRILASGEAVRNGRRHRFRPIGGFVVKGRHGVTEVFEPVDPRHCDADWFDRYQTAFGALKAGRPDAAELFAALYREKPDDPCVAFHYRRLAARETGALMIMTEK
jgi:adenylate cyclase